MFDFFKKMSFLYVKFVHLLTDQKKAVYVRAEKRVRNIYKCLKLYDRMYEQKIGEV